MSPTSTLGCSQPSCARSPRARSCFPAGTDNFGGEESYTGKSSSPHAPRQAWLVSSPGCLCPWGAPAAPCRQLWSLRAAGMVVVLAMAAVTMAPSILVPQGTPLPGSRQGWQTAGSRHRSWLQWRLPVGLRQHIQGLIQPFTWLQQGHIISKLLKNIFLKQLLNLLIPLWAIKCCFWCFCPLQHHI